MLENDMVLDAQKTSNIVKNFMAVIKKACIDIGERPPILKSCPATLKYLSGKHLNLCMNSCILLYAQLRYVVNKDDTVWGDQLPLQHTTWADLYLYRVGHKACERRLPKDELEQSMSLVPPNPAANLTSSNYRGCRAIISQS